MNNNADDYSVPLTSYTIGDGIAKEDLVGKQAVFDPAYPYIYLPADEFMDFATHMTKVWKTPLFTENVCEVKYGTCNFPASCTDVLAKMEEDGTDFTLKFNLKGTDGKEMAVSLPWRDMIIEPKESEMTQEEKDAKAEICYLPIYALRNEVSNKWILGKIIMERYYSVFDLT